MLRRALHVRRRRIIGKSMVRHTRTVRPIRRAPVRAISQSNVRRQRTNVNLFGFTQRRYKPTTNTRQRARIPKTVTIRPTPPPMVLKKRKIRFDQIPLNIHPFETLHRDSSMYYQNIIPKRYIQHDLFDKTLRMHVISNYILKHTNYYADFMKPDHRTIKLPERLGQLFVISFRPDRLTKFKERLGPWANSIQVWPGVNGETLDKQKLLQDKILKYYEFRKGEPTLRRGEMGCYLAHHSLWKHISDHNIPFVTILEDDADIRYGHETVARLYKMFYDIDQSKIDYDLIYLGHNDYFQPTHRYPNTEIAIPGNCQGFFTYHISLNGIRKLLANALPMGPPIDIYTFDQKHVKQLSIEPRLNWVVPVWSDTNNIR